jgi:hypothetical protein
MAKQSITKQAFEIVVESVKLEKRDKMGPRYAWQTGEQYEVYLNIVGRTIDGDLVYINTPGMDMTVTTGGGAAVVLYGAENDWILPAEDYCVTKDSSTLKKATEAKIKVGQFLKVTGKVKKEYADGAKALNYVKLVSVAEA